MAADPIHQFQITKLFTLGHIGGQEIAKTGKGLLVYHPMLFGREGILAAASVIATPFLLLLIMVRLFPPWPQEPKPA